MSESHDRGQLASGIRARLLRLIRIDLDESPSAPPRSSELSAISAMVFLFRNWQLAGLEMERLSRHLERRAVDEGLRSLERVCDLIRITDALLEVVRHQASNAYGAATPYRRELLASIEAWLVDARRELPAAGVFLYTIAGDSALRDSVSSARQRFVE